MPILAHEIIPYCQCLAPLIAAWSYSWDWNCDLLLFSQLYRGPAPPSAVRSPSPATESGLEAILDSVPLCCLRVALDTRYTEPAPSGVSPCPTAWLSGMARCHYAQVCALFFILNMTLFIYIYICKLHYTTIWWFKRKSKAFVKLEESIFFLYEFLLVKMSPCTPTGLLFLQHVVLHFNQTVPTGTSAVTQISFQQQIKMVSFSRMLFFIIILACKL